MNSLWTRIVAQWWNACTASTDIMEISIKEVLRVKPIQRAVWWIPYMGASIQASIVGSWLPAPLSASTSGKARKWTWLHARGTKYKSSKSVNPLKWAFALTKAKHVRVQLQAVWVYMLMRTEKRILRTLNPKPACTPNQPLLRDRAELVQFTTAYGSILHPPVSRGLRLCVRTYL